MKEIYTVISKKEAKRLIDETPSEFIIIRKIEQGSCSKEEGKIIIQAHTGAIVYTNTSTLGMLDLYGTEKIDLIRIDFPSEKSILFPLRI